MPAGGDEKTKARPLSHDVFDHVSQDLTHATTFDLGKHEIDQRLDSFAQELMVEGEKPKLPLVRDKKRIKTAELDDMDLISSLALIDESGSKKQEKPVLEMPGKEALKKDENKAGQSEEKPELAKSNIPVDSEQKDEVIESAPIKDETKSQEAK